MVNGMRFGMSAVKSLPDMLLDYSHHEKGNAYLIRRYFIKMEKLDIINYYG